MGKILTCQCVEKLVAKLKKEHKVVVATNGCFDILHVGHVRYLKKSRQCGDVLFVGVNSDHSVRALKGEGRPYNNENNRLEVLAALASVDYVVLFNETTATQFIQLVKPDVYTKGEEYLTKDLPEKKIVETWGGKIEYISMVEHMSTTTLLEKLP